MLCPAVNSCEWYFNSNLVPALWRPFYFLCHSELAHKYFLGKVDVIDRWWCIHNKPPFSSPSNLLDLVVNTKGLSHAPAQRQHNHHWPQPLLGFFAVLTGVHCPAKKVAVIDPFTHSGHIDSTWNPIQPFPVKERTFVLCQWENRWRQMWVRERV